MLLHYSGSRTPDSRIARGLHRVGSLPRHRQDLRTGELRPPRIEGRQGRILDPERDGLSVVRTAALESGNPSIQQVAAACGFGDPERMRRSFLRVLGTPPTALKRRGRRD